jgi:hypothetical protein
VGVIGVIAMGHFLVIGGPLAWWPLAPGQDDYESTVLRAYAGWVDALPDGVQLILWPPFFFTDILILTARQHLGYGSVRVLVCVHSLLWSIALCALWTLLQAIRRRRWGT